MMQIVITPLPPPIGWGDKVSLKNSNQIYIVVDLCLNPSGVFDFIIESPAGEKRVKLNQMRLVRKYTRKGKT